MYIFLIIVAHKGFPIPQSVLQLIAEMSSDRNRQCKEGEIDEYKISQIQSFLKGLKVSNLKYNSMGTLGSWIDSGNQFMLKFCTFFFCTIYTKYLMAVYFLIYSAG